MKLPPEGARWLVSLRWVACILLMLTIWIASSLLKVVEHPLPLYAIGGLMAGYNLAFQLSQRDWSAGERNVQRNILLQVVCGKSVV